MGDHWDELLRKSGSASAMTSAESGQVKPAKLKKTVRLAEPEPDSSSSDERFVPDTTLLHIPRPSTGGPVPVMTVEEAEELAAAMRALKRKRMEKSVPEKSEDKKTDVAALERHLEALKYKVPKGVKRVPWIETLSITLDKSIEDEKLDVAEDFRRETAVHDLTLIGVQEALSRLTSIGLPFTRPNDFYAEMLKSDQQMLKVRSKLADEQSRIKAVEDRKKHQLEKKFAKKVRAKKVKQKQEAKGKNLKKIEEWKQSKFQKTLEK